MTGAIRDQCTPTSCIWRKSEECALAVRPAESWRASVADHLRREADAVFALVFTCPAGDIRGARGCVSSVGGQRPFQDDLADVLSHIDERELVPTRANCTARMPMDRQLDRRLVAAVRKTLQPMGAVDLLTAYLVDERSLIVGCLALGTSQPAKFALASSGPALTRVAELASRTLQSAMGLARGCLGTGPTGESLSLLSARESQVASLAVRGLTDHEIALRLGISEETVGTHLRRTYSKLRIGSRIDLVRSWFGMEPAANRRRAPRPT